MLSRGFKEQIYDVFKFLPEKVRDTCCFGCVGGLTDGVVGLWLVGGSLHTLHHT